MKVESTLLENREAKLVIRVETEEFEKAKRQAAHKISKDISIPGFRPGKAPYEVVLRTVGEKAIIEQALDTFLDEIYPQALQEAQLEPAAPGHLINFTLTPEVTFTFHVVLQPEVVLPEDYRQLRIPYEPPTVSEEELQEELFSLQLDNALLEAVERPIDEGDAVNLRILTPDGAARTVNLYISLEHQNDEADKKLKESLLGRKAGDAFDFIVTPAEKPEITEEETWHIVIEGVSKVTLPTLEEVAGQMHLTVEQMTEDLRRFLERSKQEAYDQKYVGEVLKALRERSRLVYSPQLLEESVQEVLESTKQALARSGMGWKFHLSTLGLSEEEYIEKRLRPRVKEELEISLLTSKIWEQEQLSLEQEEVMDELSNELERLRQRGVDIRKLTRKRENASLLFNRAIHQASDAKVFRFLIDLASGELERREQEAAQQASAPQEPATAGESAPSATEAQPEAAEEQQAVQE